MNRRARIHRLRLLPALALAALLAAACGPPCDQDPLGCGDGEEFSFEPSCELEGSLDVELGEGISEFAPLAPGQEPTVHEGSQGGRHLSLAIRVAEPTTQYPQLKLLFAADLKDPDRCGEEQDCDPWVNTGQRELSLGPDLALDHEGNLEEEGFILVISIWPTDLERRLRLEVVDPCRREGSFEHLIPPAQ